VYCGDEIEVICRKMVDNRENAFMCAAIPSQEIHMADPHELISLTADIVSAHLSNNSVRTGEVPQLIRNVYDALTKATAPAEPEAAPQEPAVSVRSSVKHDYIVCLEDGKKLKMLKRYLRTNYDMTPEQYRAKWNLPRDYPMVAPVYAEQRRGLAHSIGLGKTGRKIVEDVKAASSKMSDSISKAREHLSGDVAPKAPAKRGRPAKAKAVEAPAE
jgi:predicted transcriptional regulator